MTAPPIPPELVDWLRRSFPDRVPGLGDSDREVWASVGRQQVVRFVADTAEQQTNPPELPEPPKTSVAERILRRVLSFPVHP